MFLEWVAFPSCVSKQANNTNDLIYILSVQSETSLMSYLQKRSLDLVDQDVGNIAVCNFGNPLEMVVCSMIVLERVVAISKMVLKRVVAIFQAWHRQPHKEENSSKEPNYVNCGVQ